jgi:hypothetical protein
MCRRLNTGKCQVIIGIASRQIVKMVSFMLVISGYD